MLVRDNKHLEQEGLHEIVCLREKLNRGRGRKRKYNIRDYQTSQQESSETIR